ncbi:hypothetical protein N665_0169s0009 [Sinapis alba]|nr:hypothetical protein N665_0169s0009 [Sinapis alba]
MVTSSQEKSCRSKPLLRLDTSIHNSMEEKKQVDASTAKYHPKDEPHKRDLDKHVHQHLDKKRIHTIATKFQQATTTRRKGTSKTPCPEYIAPPHNNPSIWLLKPTRLR